LLARRTGNRGGKIQSDHKRGDAFHSWGIEFELPIARLGPGGSALRHDNCVTSAQAAHRKETSEEKTMETVAWASLLVAIVSCCFLDKSLGQKIATTSRWVLIISGAVCLVSYGLVEFHVLA
jgi:hypothetical protein